ncbi:MAG: hypothetical protein KatS3mg115_2166 [Candidatus Poribacteria bacterium]|nr:MAG: hypothetical protein KatS3mg115_2166 [Candidatus Poribacteria bacterium]
MKDPLRLLNPNGEVVDTFTPSTSARSGVSFERIDFAGPDAPENWQFCYLRTGHTLGLPSSRPEDAEGQELPELSRRFIVINEILFRPRPDAPEWVELYNPQKVDAPLLGWTVADSRDRPVPLPPVTLPAGGYVVLTRNAEEFRAAYPNAPPETIVAELALPTLNNTGDRVVLRGPNGEVVDAVEYGSVDLEEGQSLERRHADWDSERLDNWLPAVDLSYSTPGTENSVSQETGERPVLVATPNPFDPDEGPTELRFEAPLRSTISLRIFDSAGTLIRVLLDEEPHGGRQSLLWDGTDDAGNAVAPGIYIAQLLAIVDEKPKATAIAVVVAQR